MTGLQACLDHLCELETIAQRIAVQERRLGADDPDVLLVKRDVERLRAKAMAQLRRLRAADAFEATDDVRHQTRH